MKFLIFFIKRNKTITIIFVVSFILSWVYGDITDKTEDVFPLINQIVIGFMGGFMGGFIFYTIQTGYANYKSWKVFSKILIPKLTKISELMKIHLNILFINYLKKEYKDSEYNKDVFKEIYDQLDYEHFLAATDKNGNQITVRDEQIRHKKIVGENIYDIFRVIGVNLERETQELLNEILGSDYFQSIEFIENNKLGNQNITSKEVFTSDNNILGVGVFKMVKTNYEDLYKYRLLIKELDEYIEKQNKEIESSFNLLGGNSKGMDTKEQI